MDSTDKRLLSMLTKAVQLTGAASYESQMKMHTSTLNTDISLAREFQKHLSYSKRKNGVMDQGKDRKSDSKQKCT